MREYLKHGDEAYTIGAYIQWDNENKRWVLVSIEEDIYYNGEYVSYVEPGCQPYIESENSCDS